MARPLPSRITAYLPLLVMALLACVTYWLLQSSIRPNSGAAPRPVDHTPDYFADDFAVTTLNDQGNAKYRLNAKSMVHYEDDENSILTLPAMRAFPPGEPIITATSLRGVVNGDGSVVNLYDNAHVYREPSATDPPMQADSQHFLILTNSDIIKTEKPVTLRRGPSISTATQGMLYTNTTRNMELFGDVRGSIDASQLNGGSRR